MYVVAAIDTRGNMSVYGYFSREALAQEWAQENRARDVELTVCPVLDPRETRRRGQMTAIDPDWSER